MDERLDILALVAPLDGDAGQAGVDLRTSADSSSFFALKDLRAEARTAERTAASNPDDDTSVLDAGVGKWSDLVDLAGELLTTQTKDLEIAGWLCEGVTRIDSFRGLADGLMLMDQLLLRYWDDGLFPTEDEDGVETRIAPVAGLLGLSGAAALLQPIRLLPISDRDRDVALWALDSTQGPVQGEDVEARERAAARRSERLEQVRGAVRRSAPAFLRETYSEIRSALASINSIVATVDRVAQTGPFGTQVIEPLRTVLAFYDEQVGDILLDPTSAPAAQSDASTGGEAPAARGGGATPGRVGGREEAFAAILGVAQFFEQSEPQSLVARGLRDVVRRARMPIDELLAELLPEADQRVLFLQRAGVKLDLPRQEDLY